MEDPTESDVSTTTFVFFLLTLSAVGVVWTLSCSWLTGMKKRQRVSSITTSDDSTNAGSITRIKEEKEEQASRHSLSRHSSPPIQEVTRPYIIPNITITPPSPQIKPPDDRSLETISTSGSPVDILPESGVADVEEIGPENVKVKKHSVFRSKLKKLFGSIAPPSRVSTATAKSFYIVEETEVTGGKTDSCCSVNAMTVGNDSGVQPSRRDSRSAVGEASEATTYDVTESFSRRQSENLQRLPEHKITVLRGTKSF